MASINQLVSEIAHSIQQANSVPVRNAIRLAVIHNRNKLIRQSFEKHNYIDKVIQQRYRISLINVPDGDIPNTANFDLPIIKRSTQRVPRPVRLDNNLPFLSVRTIGVENPIEVAFVKEASSKFYKHLPGFCRNVTYDYINQYIYINAINDADFRNLGSIIVESPFEYPIEIQEEHIDGNYNYSDDDEFMISEDMIYDLKKLVLDEMNPQIVRQTNEVPTPNLIK